MMKTIRTIVLAGCCSIAAPQVSTIRRFKISSLALRFRVKQILPSFS
jgi:hypothetical protein